jgi:hypothetical protein
MARARDPWLRLGFAACSLGLEASAVVGLRTMKILAGGAAGEAEARRMVSEKVKAGLALQALALSGGLGLSTPGAVSKTLVHYRRPVRANLRRLTRS